jgi:hypothetical protein
MGDKEKVVEILRNKTQGIKFGFVAPSGLRVSVDYSTFARVAEAVENDRILVVVRPPGMPENAAGIYAPDNSTQVTSFGRHGHITRYISGKFLLRDVDSLSGQGNVVHEAVHASLDLTHNPNLMALESEAAGYIAQSLFYRNFNFFPIYRQREAEDDLWETARLTAFTVASGTLIPTDLIAHLIRIISLVAPYNDRGNYSYPSNG